MPVIDVTIQRVGDPPCWPMGPAGVRLRTPADDRPLYLAGLASGMESGAPSVALRVDLPDGTRVVAQTSLAAWIAATCALRGAFPEAFAGTPLAAAP